MYTIISIHMSSGSPGEHMTNTGELQVGALVT